MGPPLPLEGTGYQVLRSRTNRYYGHPNTIDFVESLALKANQKLKTTLLIGDLSLPRGGRFSSGHSSHQTGLDIDIWLRLADSPLSYNELQLPKPMSVVDLQDYSILNHRWDKRHFELIRYAAKSDEVARIFVHPVIKEQLCAQEGEKIVLGYVKFVLGGDIIIIFMCAYHALTQALIVSIKHLLLLVMGAVRS